MSRSLLETAQNHVHNENCVSSQQNFWLDVCNAQVIASASIGFLVRSCSFVLCLSIIIYIRSLFSFVDYSWFLWLLHLPSLFCTRIFHNIFFFFCFLSFFVLLEICVCGMCCTSDCVCVLAIWTWTVKWNKKNIAHCSVEKGSFLCQRKLFAAFLFNFQESIKPMDSN